MLKGAPVDMNRHPISLDEAPQFYWFACDRAKNVETLGWFTVALSVNLLPETGYFKCSRELDILRELLMQ